MTFMTTNYSKNTGGAYDPLPTGTYEVVIAKAQEAATKNGAESLQLDLVVRNDLDGVTELAETNKKYHNRHVFMDNWKRKATGQYDMQGFQYILDAIGIPEGTQLNTVEDFLNVLTNKPAKVYVKKEKNEYNGSVNEVNRVAPWNFEKSDYQQMQHKFKDSTESKGQQIDIKEDDLPF
jgi:hypothetical protein